MTTGHLATPPDSPAAQALYAEDLHDLGFVMNVSRLWAYHPELVTDLFTLMGQALTGQGFSHQQVGVVVAACASTIGDSYCSLAWGTKLAAAASDVTAAGVLAGDDSALPMPDRALAGWVRQLASAPNSTTPADLDRLRAAGWADQQVFAITVYAALRIAFSTVNDALGIGPDDAFHDRAPAAVRAAVDYGRAIDAAHAPSHA